MLKCGIIILFVFVYVGVGTRIFAQSDEAKIYFWTHNDRVAPGSEFPVWIYVDSETPLNAFDVQIAYSPRIFELVRFDTSLSLIDVWKERPTLKEEGVLHIRGGKLIAFLGTRGELVRLDFRVKTVGTGFFSFRKAHLYAADGSGTLVPADHSFYELTATPEVPVVDIDVKSDFRSPIFRSVHVLPNALYDDDVLVVFDSVDAESTIREVYVSFRKWFIWSDWLPVSSPFRLPRGAWSLELRSVDQAGNKTTEMFYIYSVLFWKLGLVLLGIFVLIYFSFRLHLFFIRRRGRIMV